MNTFRLRLTAILLVAAIAMPLAFLASQSAFQGPRHFLLDRFFWLRGPEVAGDQVTLVPVTEECFQALEQYWPFDAELFATAIRNIKADGARVVALDFLLTDPYRTPSTESVELLRSALADGVPTVCAVIHERYRIRERINGQLRTRDAQVLLTPHESLTGCYVPGLINKAVDSDGGVRWFRAQRQDQQGVTHLSLVAATAIAAQGVGTAEIQSHWTEGPGWVSFADRKLPADPQGRFLINYRGSAWSTPAVPFYAVAMGGFPAGTFRGKTVIIGPGFKESRDFFPTPFTGSPEDPGMLAPGAEIMSSALDTILTDRSIALVSRLSVLRLALLMALLAAAGALATNGLLLPLIAPVLLLITSLLLPAYLFLQRHLFLDPLPLLAAVLTAAISGAIVQSLLFRRQAREARALFSRYVASDVARLMLRDGVKLPLSGRDMEVCVLFADIRGFTQYAHTTSPAGLFRDLNEFFEIIVEEVFREGAMLDKFMGDAAMVVFGAPLPMEKMADRALATTLRIRDRIALCNAKRREMNQTELPMGFGLSIGTAQVGNIGSARRMEYTAIGDTVNLASRLQHLAGPYEIVFSEVFCSRLSNPPDHLRRMHAEIKGMEGGIDVCVLTHDSTQS